MTLDETLKEEISRNAHHVGFLVRMHVSAEHLDIRMQKDYDEIGKLCELYGFDHVPYYEYYKELIKRK
jgi:hypothetical protein